MRSPERIMVIHLPLWKFVETMANSTVGIITYDRAAQVRRETKTFEEAVDLAIEDAKEDWSVPVRQVTKEVRKDIAEKARKIWKERHG